MLIEERGKAQKRIVDGMSAFLDTVSTLFNIVKGHVFMYICNKSLYLVNVSDFI